MCFVQHDGTIGLSAQFESKGHWLPNVGNSSKHNQNGDAKVFGDSKLG